MIYDPSRRALELRERILASMSAKELEEYQRQARITCKLVGPFMPALMQLLITK